MGDLLTVAKSFIGTPHVNGGMVKGAGVDCCTLPVMIYRELGLAEIPVKVGYSADWFCRKDCEEILHGYLVKYFNSVAELRQGDLISYAWGRAKYAHLSMFLGNGRVLHCQADVGVEITDFNNPYFLYGNGKSRITGYWRLRNGII